MGMAPLSVPRLARPMDFGFFSGFPLLSPLRGHLPFRASSYSVSLPLQAKKRSNSDVGRRKEKGSTLRIELQQKASRYDIGEADQLGELKEDSRPNSGRNWRSQFYLHQPRI